MAQKVQILHDYGICEEMSHLCRVLEFNQGTVLPKARALRSSVLAACRGLHVKQDRLTGISSARTWALIRRTLLGAIVEQSPCIEPQDQWPYHA